MPLTQLLAEVPGARITGEGMTPISGLTLDSRRARPGNLFAALKGAKTDGLAFVPAALAAGAAAVLAEEPRPAGLDCPWVRVPDARGAFALAARAWFGRPDTKIPVLGITGTNGKTTITYLLEAIVQACGGSAGVLGTVSYRLPGRAMPAARTTPEADLLFEALDQMVSAGCTHGVIEVSSHALALRRVHGLDFAAALFTNLTQDHLDFHGTMEAYFEAKSLLFRSLRPGALAVLNADSPASARLAALTPARVVTYGLAPGSDFRIVNLQTSFEGIRCDIVRKQPGASDVVLGPIVSPLPGLPNASNVAAAFAAAASLGFDVAGILRGLRAFRGAPGRFERIDRGQDFQVIVDYAHTPDALRGLLETVRALGPARILTVFGCGGDRDRSKRAPMAEAAARGSDAVVLTSDNPRTEDPERILDDAEAGFAAVPGAAGRARRIVDRREAIAAAIALAAPGDAIVIAGKGHETTQTLADRTIPFDDRQIAAECLDLRMGRG